MKQIISTDFDSSVFFLNIILHNYVNRSIVSHHDFVAEQGPLVGVVFQGFCNYLAGKDEGSKFSLFHFRDFDAAGTGPT